MRLNALHVVLMQVIRYRACVKSFYCENCCWAGRTDEDSFMIVCLSWRLDTIYASPFCVKSFCDGGFAWRRTVDMVWRSRDTVYFGWGR